MSPSIPSLSKPICSSTHSVRNSFRPYHEQSQKYTSPRLKLETIFTQEPIHLKSLRLHYNIDKRKQNMTCINIGIDDEEAGLDSVYDKKKQTGRGKFRPSRTRRQESKKVSNVTSVDRPKAYKRNRHQSLVNVAEQYHIFSPDQKKNLQKHQKKLTDSLNKTETSFKTSYQFAPGIKLFSYLNNNKPINDVKLDDELFKLKQQPNFSPNETSVSKWKFWAHQIHDMKQGIGEPTTKSSHIQSRMIAEGKKKLARRHFKQNTTLDGNFGHSLTEQPILVIRKSATKQNCPEKKGNSLLKQNYQKTLILKEKFKFMKINVNDSDEKENVETPYEEDSLSKLKKIIRSRKISQKKDNNPFVAPWDYPPSERQIDVES